MEERRLQYLLVQQSEGMLTEPEAAELELWYQRKTGPVNFTDRLTDHGLKALENSLLDRISSQLEENEISYEEKTVVEKPRFFAFSYKIAASIALLLVAAIAFFVYQQRMDLQVYTTAYGELKTVPLPDGSEVILNGNSTLKYKDNWGEQDTREVFLTGEAYFKIVHTAQHQPMRVTTDGSFSVDVLGTQFSVSSRKAGSRVVLNEGKVQCNLGSSKSDTLILAPGELMSFTSDPKAYIRKAVDADMYSSWTKQKLILQNTPLVEVFQMIEDTYGYVVKVHQPEILNREMSGSVPMENLDVLLEGISVVCHVHIQKHAQQLVLTAQK
jgi:transmembrane sensor